MKIDKVVSRIARLSTEPELLEQVARDVGAGLAAGERDELETIARELAARAPHRARGAKASEQEYWAGYAAAIGTLLAAQRATAEKHESRQAALQHAQGETAQGVLAVLATGPATGAEVAAQLGVTPGAASKLLTMLRGAGLVRTLGGQPYPKRGARKPHVLTPLGSWAADELRRRRRAAGVSPISLVAG
jgi:CRP-like cAMP-binding protein